MLSRSFGAISYQYHPLPIQLADIYLPNCQSIYHDKRYTALNFNWLISARSYHFPPTFIQRHNLHENGPIFMEKTNKAQFLVAVSLLDRMINLRLQPSVLSVIQRRSFSRWKRVSRVFSESEADKTSQCHRDNRQWATNMPVNDKRPHPPTSPEKTQRPPRRHIQGYSHRMPGEIHKGDRVYSYTIFGAFNPARLQTNPPRGRAHLLNELHHFVLHILHTIASI